MPKSFAEKINKAKLLVEAMRNNKETLPKPLTEEFIEDLAKTRLRQRTMGRVRLRRQEVKLYVKKG